MRRSTRRPIPARPSPHAPRRGGRRASLPNVDPEADALLKQALALPPEARCALAAALFESLDGPAEPDAVQAWAEEIARRVRDIEAGRTQPIPCQEALRRLRGD